MTDLPSGTVTFLFTDVEGSTQLLHKLGAEAYAYALAEHRRMIRGACSAEGGVEVDTQGDAFFFAFPTAPGALDAASAFTDALASGAIRVRVGLHTGSPLLTDEGYVGTDVHRAARIAAAGHGGQVLVSASTASLAEHELMDLGEHRLKDLSAPERIYQLADGDFPPLKSLYRTNLPIPATPFLGRERELVEVVGLLTRDDVRLLTLTGPGGTGKTRLALQAAAEASESFPDGVYWVPLAPLREPALILSSLARALAVSDEPGTPLEDTLSAHLSGKSQLLLLDNVEHLLPAAAERIAAVRTSNGSRLLVTSRERLRIGGEQAWPVPPLEDDDGTELFVARARAIDPAFAPSRVIHELCARLDELPLAIELAAARTAVFSAEQLLERLPQRLDLLKGDRDTDPRQQTLRATIEWSHDLLDKTEQQLFARLAVFVGGGTYEAAEEVAGADPDTLQSLLDKSLVRKRDADGGPRYWMLEMIREYAVERLEASGEAEHVRRRHAEWFLTLAEEAGPQLSQESTEWLDRLEPEHDNVRTALDSLETVGEQELRLRLVAAFWWFWSLRGHLEEGMRRVEDALARDTRPTATRARALTGAQDLAADLDDNATSKLRGEEALSLHRELGDDWGVAYNQLGLGLVFASEDDFETAQPLFEESVRLFGELGDEHWTLQASRRLAWSYEEHGEPKRARQIQEDILHRARASGDEALEAKALGVLAMYSLDDGQVDDVVVSRLAAAHRIYRERRNYPDRYWHAILLCRFARALALRDRGAAAAKLLACYRAQLEEIGVGEEERWVVRVNERTLAAIEARLDEASIADAGVEGRELTADEAVELALDELDAPA
jgi:predicted ATPase/class 3 adenylate cyclase